MLSKLFALFTAFHFDLCTGGVMEKEVGDKGPVNFIVGDDGAENDVDASAAEFREERQDIFPPSTDLLSPQSSYNNMFGVAERRKRLR